MDDGEDDDVDACNSSKISIAILDDHASSPSSPSDSPRSVNPNGTRASVSPGRKSLTASTPRVPNARPRSVTRIFDGNDASPIVALNQSTSAPDDDDDAVEEDNEAHRRVILRIFFDTDDAPVVVPVSRAGRTEAEAEADIADIADIALVVVVVVVGLVHAPAPRGSVSAVARFRACATVYKPETHI